MTDLTTVSDTVPVLHRCSMTVAAGSVTVLLGLSGSGKSTLVRHIAGLRPPDSGTVEIDGRDLWDDGEALRVARSRMSVLVEGPSLFDASLFSSLTACENIVYGLEARGVHPSTSRAVARRRLAELGLADHADELPALLPAHARKRLAVARALSLDAPLLVMDGIEPCFDATHRDRLLGALRRQHERTSCTMLLATHDVALARDLDATVLVLANGRIVTTGPATEVLRGVDDAEEFDRRFRVADFVGVPYLPSLDETPADAVFPIDEDLLWKALAALVLVATLAAVLPLLPVP